MTEAAEARPPDNLSSGFRRSLIIHGAVFLFVVLKTLVFPGKPMTYVPTLRVDIVGLPDQLKNELANMKTPAPDVAEALKQAQAEAKAIQDEAKTPPAQKPTPKEASEERAAKDEMVLKPKHAAPEKNERDRTKKNKSALDRIKALAKISGEESEKPSKASAPLIKGNAISKGTSLSGEAREAAEASYYDHLRARLQENWALPVWIARQKLSARVQIFIDGRGRLKAFHIVKSSGNPQFDEAVKRTLTESQPFPLPPAALLGSVSADGVLIGFPL